ncbi:hypothetical protein V5O48_018770, partial [Marasmius crinis-equi]
VISCRELLEAAPRHSFDYFCSQNRLRLIMPACPLCSKQCKSEHGVRVHLAICPKKQELRVRPPMRKRAKTVQQDEMRPAEEGLNDERDDGATQNWGFSDEQQATAGPSTAQQGTRSSGRARKVPGKFDEYEISTMSAVVKGRRTVPLSALATPAVAPASPVAVPATPVPEPAPPSPSDALDPTPGSPTPPPNPTPPPLPIIERFYYKTEPNNVGIYRIYDSNEPSRIPDAHASISQLVDAPSLTREKEAPTVERIRKSMGVSPHPEQPEQTQVPGEADLLNLGPFANVSVFRLMRWSYEEKEINAGSLNRLAQSVLAQPDLDYRHFGKFDAHRDLRKLDKMIEDMGSDDPSKKIPLPFESSDIWRRGTISIPMPCTGKRYESEEDAPQLVIPDVWYRRPLDLIKTIVKDQDFMKFHVRPFKEFWKWGDRVQRIYGDAFTSNRAIRIERDKVERLEALGISDDLELVVLWLMLASDSTHLTNFGTASLWPIYMYFGNCSKYERGHPKFHTAHHIAYIPHIADLVGDVYREKHGQPPTEAVLRHIKREVMQAVWNLILDDEFVGAYEKSVVLECYDKISRRFVPEFFSYSADYPEKVAIICIKHLGTCLCVRCLCQKHQVRLLGTKNDMVRRVKQRRVDSTRRQNLIKTARWHIFSDGRPVESDIVKQLLDDQSLTPVSNAFSDKLLPYGFDVYSLLVVDLLHEFEIGIWKSVLTHLVRMLYSQKDSSVEILDERYRRVPTFGRDIIRRFHNNVSDMKKLAARDFEDILQCAMPCFEQLFPKKKDDRVVQNLLFDLATWHAYAKLRLHTDSTVASLQEATRQLGQSLRAFHKAAEKFDTHETPKEMAARQRREAQKKKKLQEKRSQAATDGTDESEDTKSGKAKSGKGAKKGKNRKNRKKKKKTGALQKPPNIDTPKFHFIGDYVESILEYGTTDSYKRVPTPAGEAFLPTFEQAELYQASCSPRALLPSDPYHG